MLIHTLPCCPALCKKKRVELKVGEGADVRVAVVVVVESS